MNVLRRISMESIDLIQRYDEVIHRKDLENNYLIIEVLSKYGNKFIFYIDANYPFKNPEKIFLNNNNYLNTLKLIKPFRKLLKETSNVECLCCHSLTCQNNWTPCKRLWELVDEGDRVILMKKKIFYLYYARKIACDFLTHDIPIESYL